MRTLVLFLMFVLSLSAMAQAPQATPDPVVTPQMLRQEQTDEHTLALLNAGYACHPSHLNVPKPSFSLQPGSYNAPQKVKLTDLDRRAVIHFTTDGTTPSVSSPLFTRRHKPLFVSSTTRIQAFAISCDGHSLIPDAVFTLPNQAAPTPTPVHVHKPTVSNPPAKPTS